MTDAEDKPEPKGKPLGDATTAVVPYLVTCPRCGAKVELCVPCPNDDYVAVPRGLR